MVKLFMATTVTALTLLAATFGMALGGNVQAIQFFVF